MVDRQELEAYYVTHSNMETAQHFGIGKTTLLRWLTTYGITRKVVSKQRQSKAEFFAEFYSTYDKNAFIADFSKYQQKELCKKYNLTISQIRSLKADLGLHERLKRVEDYVIDDVDNFYAYYKSHSDTDTIKQYQLTSASILKKLLQKYGLEQKPLLETFDQLLERVSYEELRDYYNTHTLAECKQHFKTQNLYKLLKFYNLTKAKSREPFESVAQRIDKDEFIKAYQETRYEDLYNKYNLSYTTIRKLKDYFGIDNKTVEAQQFLATIDTTAFCTDITDPHMSKTNIMQKYNIPTSCCFDSLCQLLSIKNRILGSSFELDVYNYLTTVTDLTLLQHVRNAPGLENKELDIYVPDLHLGIELNGTYWHSTLQKQDRQYHYKKSLAAERAGIHLIHIWEYEWNDPIKQNIVKTFLQLIFHKIPTRIYARHCIVKQISNKVAESFNAINHLQGHRNAQVTYGLFYKDELVQLMSFSRTRYNKNLTTENSWEIIRGCPGSNNLVVGGVSKLFAAFVRDYGPDKVFSYCDFNKFDGKSYLALGMKFIGYTGPDLKYVMKDHTVVNRNPRKYKQNMSTAVALIYGAGSKKYLWSKS